MAQAYVPIQTVTVGSGGSASITFTNIPQNYTDLCLKISARSATAAANWALISINGGSDTAVSLRHILNNSGSLISQSYSSFRTPINQGSFTNNIFANSEIYFCNYTSSNHKTMSGDGVQENSSSEVGQQLASFLWSNSAAITSLTLTVDGGGNFAQHTTATLYGIGGTRATGGTITADSTYTYHTFTSTGSFTALENIKGAEVLAVAGGGGGGSSSGGGGGAGGVLYTPGQLLPAGTTYTAVIGAGGAVGSSGQRGVSGSNSTFSSFVAIGGGGGSGTTGGQVGGLNGGSGGGGFSTLTSFGLGTSGQGNNGGAGSITSDAAGGGGGAGAVGSNASTSLSGNGGVGSSSYSSWGYATSTGQLSGGVYYYAGGGGGGGLSSVTPGSGGLGGGGAGSSGSTGTAGTANTGGGGGGGYWTGSSAVAAGAGGSGLLIIRYPN